MKILLTGGGTGGHFYPIIAIASAIRAVAREEKIIAPQIYYMAETQYDSRVLFDNEITFVPISAGKVRTYFSILNFFDLFKTAWGMIKATIDMFSIYPDVVFGKGGYVSFPALFAARILRIPVIIHESDSTAGKVNKWAAKFAQKIAISYKEAADDFPAEKVAFTGNPIRPELITPLKNGAYEFLKLDPNVPTILIIGGSQGSQLMNDTILDILPSLVEKYQVIHQTGKNNFKDVSGRANIILQNNAQKERYHPYDYLNTLALRMVAGIAELVVSRAGSTIFEIACWGIPSILVPIEKSNGDHQRKNAFSYAREGGAVVIEEPNLTPHVLTGEISRLMGSKEIRERMSKSARIFAHTDSATVIAKEIVSIALRHEN
ncbi:UDP-N-acetylglucosamine--N-acetylmuramyl-(pentapeptide) pyrophosphoryl-undecaprenol N-acetylglucosamine transferase [Patescibacteria group bacterium]|nr:MAG: UDP-N-acetylglucosamine--N-acetylmuramyl-(pentapeptide) pyrophosphoryl-undecaprenol N-acetylglucosamine transferase [Patescibacteria group bacterium]